MIKTLTAFLIAVVLFFPSVNPAFAQMNTSSTSAQVMRVDHVANLRDRILERITLFFKFSSDSSEQYQQELVEKRLAELKYIVDNNKGDQIEDMTSRYSTYLGRMTEYVISHKMINKKDELIQLYNRHIQVLEDLIKNFEVNSGLWMLMEHDINANKIYQQQMKDFK
ncbi:MAG: DUF5667 domain-containing protein [Candidatus Daviesbacteria bacterium]|nr:DUF5667 domain-containing protein [Candidatus Daviesbacteria bacterium]